MKLELVIFGIAGFLIYNSYHDNKYSKILITYKKYYKIAFIALTAFSIYLMIKRNPGKSKDLLLYTNNIIKYMPIDKSSADLISPIFDLTSSGNSSYMDMLNSSINPNAQYNPAVEQTNQIRNMGNNGKATKRSVSETKKKFVAYNQGWKCGECKDQLTYTFEVDHRVRLENGGGNDVSNLVALCRECHGKKTAMDNM